MQPERRLLLLLLAGTAPLATGAAVALALLVQGTTPRLVVVATVLGLWWLSAITLRTRIVRPAQTVANILAAMNGGDYAIRARGASADDALGLVLLELNRLSETLRGQRLGAVEASTLLAQLLAEIDVAILAVDDAQRVVFANRAAAGLAGVEPRKIEGRTVTELGLGECLAGDVPRVIERGVGGEGTRWLLRRRGVRQDGRPHQLLVLSDVSRALRDEEREAWRRLVRVLSHEINNSLAPIKSLAASLPAIVARRDRDPEWEDDLARGLGVIAQRSDALARFLQAYARLARLPAPVRKPVMLHELVRRVAALESRVPIDVAADDVTAEVDADQLEQALINLVRNAADASLETGGRVRVACRREERQAVIAVEDDGPGLPQTANLFVPFFTTKPDGTGIGLALARQLIEGHGGALTLANRAETRGAVATVMLPLGG